MEKKMYEAMEKKMYEEPLIGVCEIEVVNNMMASAGDESTNTNSASFDETESGGFPWEEEGETSDAWE